MNTFLRKNWLGIVLWLIAVSVFVWATQQIKLVDLAWQAEYGHAGQAAPSLTPDRSLGQPFKPGRPFLSFIEIRLATYTAKAAGLLELTLLKGMDAPDNKKDIDRRLIARSYIDLAHVEDNQIKRWDLPEMIPTPDIGLYLMISRPRMEKGQVTAWLDNPKDWSGPKAEVLKWQAGVASSAPTQGSLVLILGGEPPRLWDRLSRAAISVVVLGGGLLFLLAVPSWPTMIAFLTRTRNLGSVRFAMVDILIVVLAASVGLYWSCSLLTDPFPTMSLSGDAGDIARWAAARLDPGAYKSDYTLSDLSNFSFYQAIEVPLVGWLYEFVGNWGQAMALLAGIVVFLQLIGFYLLGRILFSSRWLALFLSTIATGFIGVGMGTYWGLPAGIHVLPRNMFQAILPFILSFQLTILNNWKIWPVLMVVLASSLWVHPVSAPAWALSVWLGLWVVPVPGWNYSRKVAYLLCLGLVFLVAAAPYLNVYFGGTSYGETAVGSPQDCNLITRDALAAVTQFVGRMVSSASTLVLSGIGLIGMVLLSRKKETKPKALIVAAWLVGIVVCGFALPILDQMATRALGCNPLQAQLTRTLRYLIPLFLIFSLWLIKSGIDSASAAPSWIAPALCFVGVISWLAIHPPLFPSGLAECWRQGRLNCIRQPSDVQQAASAIINAARATAPESRFLAPGFDYQIRLMARRGLVFSSADNELGFRLSERTCRHVKLYDQLQQIEKLNPAQERLTGLLDLTNRLAADYLVIQKMRYKLRSQDLERVGRLVVVDNYYYALIKAPPRKLRAR